jgi:hypothetical protein
VSWSATSISCYRSDRGKYWGRSSPRRRLGCALDRDLPPGPREPHRHQRASVTQGQMPDLGSVDGSDFYFRCGRCSGGVRRLLAIVRERIPKHFGLDPSRDVKMLCAEPRRPAARSLNTELQNALKPTWPDPHRAVRLDFCPGRQGHVGRERLRQRSLQR